MRARQYSIFTSKKFLKAGGNVMGIKYGLLNTNLVSAGSIIASTNPLCAATIGLANRVVYS
jgi:hypothetical protein